MKEQIETVLHESLGLESFVERLVSAVKSTILEVGNIELFELNENPIAYCLAAMKSEGVNLIGENFMSGLKVVFDRERKVLGWKSFDCYNMGNSRSNLPVNPNPSGVPPRPSLGPNNYTPEATKGASSNGTQVNVLQPSASFSPKMHCNRNVLVAAALLFLLIL
uniref:Peptidase A1 domain-containing protein n=1 Tax=Zea mays TaxID=4577 RepID=A0A804LPI8_MAIZE